MPTRSRLQADTDLDERCAASLARELAVPVLYSTADRAVADQWRNDGESSAQFVAKRRDRPAHDFEIAYGAARVSWLDGIDW